MKTRIRSIVEIFKGVIKMNKKSILAILLVVCFVFGVMTVAKAANVLTVDVNGGTGVYTTIQAAVNAAKSGDTIIVMPGHYAGAYIARKHVSIVGSGKDTIVDTKLDPTAIRTMLSPDVTQEVYLLLGGVPLDFGPAYFVNDQIAFIIDCQSLFDVVAALDSNGNPVFDSNGNPVLVSYKVDNGADGTSISNLVINMNGWTFTDIEQGGAIPFGVYVAGAKNCIIKELELRNLADTAIGIGVDGSNCEVTHNLITGFFHDTNIPDWWAPFSLGIAINEHTDLLPTQNLVAFNEIKGLPGDTGQSLIGIQLYITDKNKIVHNKIAINNANEVGFSPQDAINLGGDFDPETGVFIGATNNYVGFNDLRGSTYPVIIDWGNGQTGNVVARNLGQTANRRMTKSSIPASKFSPRLRWLRGR